MPSSEEQFSRPPSGEEMSAEDLRNFMGNDANKSEGGAPVLSDIQKVADVLGGKVTSRVCSTKPATDSVEEAQVDDTKRKDKVDEDDRKEYIRTLLAGQSFVKRYTIYGGAVHVTFKTRTVVENDQVDIECASPVLRTMVETKTMPVIKERVRLCKTVIELFVGDTAIMMPLTLDKIKELDEVLFSALRNVYREFEGLCDDLFEMANSSDFWNQTGGAT